MKRSIVIYIIFSLLSTTLAGPSEYIDILDDVGTVQKSYEHICEREITDIDAFADSYSGICNVVKHSELCNKIIKEDQLECNDIEENNIDVLSFSFLRNCGLGLWDSFVEMVEFLYKAVVSVGKYVLFKDERSKVNDFASEALKSMKNYIAIEIAKEKDQGKDTTDAVMAVAGSLTKVMFKKLGNMIQENYVNLGCYNQASRQKRICKIVGDFIIPPVILVGAVFKGVKAVKLVVSTKKLGVNNAHQSGFNLQAQKALEKQIDDLPPAEYVLEPKSEFKFDLENLFDGKKSDSLKVTNVNKAELKSNEKLNDLSEEAYLATNKKLLDRYPQYASIVKDPEAYFKHIEELFEKQKKLNPEKPYQFDFSEYGMPVVKNMKDDLVSKIDEISVKLSKTTNPKKRAEYEANLKHLKLLQQDVAKHLKNGKITYEDSYKLGHFYSRAIGLFDTDKMPIVDRAFLELDRKFQGYNPVSAKKELELYQKEEFSLFQKQSSVDGFQEAHGMFDKASFNKDKLEMVFIPSTEHLGADIFSRLVPHDIYFMGISNKLMEADGFTRSGGDFWVHDLRHSSAIFHKKKAYEAVTNVTDAQKLALKKRADLWKQELNKEIMEIKDKKTRSAIRLFMFNFHHDRGYPMLPSSYRQFDKVDSVPYWLHFMLTVSGQPRTFDKAHKRFPEGYEWLKKFWKKREMQENIIINNKNIKDLDNKASSMKTGDQVIEGSSGIQIDGDFSKFYKDKNDEVVYFNTKGPTSLTYSNNPVKGQGVKQHPTGFGSPVGSLKGSSKKLEDYSSYDLKNSGIVEGHEVRMTYDNGVEVVGTLSKIKKQNGKIVLMTFDSAEVTGPKGEKLFGKKWGTFDMAVMDEITGKVK